MKEITEDENYWIVGSNKWSKNIYTKKQAEKYSTTLIDCSSCNDCSNCSYFKTNPQRITSPNLGSRNSQTTFYWNEEKEQIVCGCFQGTLEEFESKIKETHGDNNFAKGYFQWIDAVKFYKLTYGGNK